MYKNLIFIENEVYTLVMIIEHDREKLIDAIIYFLKKTKHCGKTKLFKLLYYLDFMHFRETGKSVTNLDYNAWAYGPVPVQLFKEINERPKDIEENLSFQTQENFLNNTSFTVITPRRKFEKKYFTKRELRILESVAFIFKEAKAKDMTEAAHLPNQPWDKTIRDKGKKEKIDYLLALDNTKESLSLEEAKERMKDKEEIVSAFNA